jgi:hypothetical protein
MSVIEDVSWRNFRYYSVFFLEGINKSWFEPKTHHLEDDVCHTVDPNIRSIDEMCVRTDRPTIELILGVSSWNI